MRITKISLLLASIAVMIISQAAFAATAVPVYTITVPESVARGDIFNATVTISPPPRPA